jgi:Domain of unknown function (DUF397)
MTDSAAWRKSSYSGGSGGNCVEVGAGRKSSYSGGSGGDWVEAGDPGRVVLVRDTKNAGGRELAFSAAAWQAFTGTLR